MPTTSSPTGFAAGIASLHPASFAMVMATGIVSIAVQLRGPHLLAVPLLWLNMLLYGALWLVTLLRVIFYREKLVADLRDHSRSVGFFTVIAATCVLGSQLVIVVEWPTPATWLWYFGIALWAVITYSVFTILTIKKKKPSLANGLNGGWLVAVVAAQSVSVLGGLVAPGLGPSRELALFFALVMWLGGGMLYVWIIALIFYRYSFLVLDPSDLTPPYWINMGAMAISTLAGAVLIGHAESYSLLQELRPFLLGVTVSCWATATWWIPLLIVLGVWRHLIRRIPLMYDVVYWSAVFPLGMYTVCTHRLAEVIDLPPLDIIPNYFVWIATAAWAVTFIGLVYRMRRFVGSRRAA
jgi:tellurite resistance protein TehA-like permease